MSSTLDQIGEDIATDATHIDAALHRLLTKLRVFDTGAGYASQGFRTCAQWLSWRVSWTLNTAREHVRVANALGGLPLIDRALERGELSYSKVRALTRVANSANESALVEMALQMTGNHLEQLCRKFASVKNHDDPSGNGQTAAPADDIDRRYIHRRDREDGMVVLEAVLHPDEAEIVWAALDRIAKERCRARTLEPAPDSDPAPTDSVSRETRSAPLASPTFLAAESVSRATEPVSAEAPSPSPAPAPSALASASASTSASPALAASPSPSPAASASPAPAASPSRKTHTPFDRATALVDMAQQVLRGTSPDRAPYDLMISIPIDTLRYGNSGSHNDCGCAGANHGSDGHRHAAPRPVTDPTLVACFNNGTTLSALAVRRLACDAGVIAMIEDANGQALSVGGKTRTIPASTKRALLRRDKKCRFPGCNATAFLEGHHLLHWALGGLTTLPNLLCVCSFHHRFVHEYGFTLEFDAETNTVSAYDPAHHRWIPAVPRTHAPDDLGWPNITRRNERFEITADTRPVWDATPVDYAEIVDVVLRAEDRVDAASAELDSN